MAERQDNPPPLRREDRRLVTGAGRFTGDLSFDGLAHAAFVRSPEAHAAIVGIDRQAALAVPGALAVMTGADLGDPVLEVPPMLDRAAMAYPVLAREFVRFAGEAIALVVADTPAAAEDTAEAVFVDLRPLPAVVDPLAAAADDHLVHPDAGTNVAVRRSVGEPGAPVPASGGRLQVEVPSARIDPLTIETFTAVAVPGPGHRVTLWCASGTPLLTRDGVAAALDRDPETITVRVPDIGGAFGQRGGVRPEYVALVAAALELGRPIRWEATRREQLITGDHGRDVRHRVTAGYSGDGRIRSLEVEVVANLGAYPHRGWFIPLTALQLAPGPYAIDHVSVEAVGVVTNTAPTGPYRGAGRPEAGLAIEEVVHAVAAATGLDPVEVRSRNYVRPGDMPSRTGTGLTHDGGDYAALLDRAADLAGRRAAEHAGSDAGRSVGIGLASFVETTAGSHVTGEYGRVEVRPDGVSVFTGSTPSGQGHATVWPVIVASRLGIDPQDVAVVTGDTGRIPQGTGTFGSRSAAVGGAALAIAADAVRGLITERAAQVLEAAPGDLEVASGSVFVRGVPSSAISLSEVAVAAEAAGEPLVAEELFVPEDQPLASGGYAAVVEVDRETGDVRILDLIAVDDCGVHLNTMIVRGQVHGGIGQGLGQAMWERIAYDGDGQPSASTLMDYLIPTASVVPSLTLDHMVTATPFNPLGVKGVGEAGTIGVPPAVLAAVRDAIGSAGDDHLELPLLSERVWRATGR